MSFSLLIKSWEPSSSFQSEACRSWELQEVNELELKAGPIGVLDVAIETLNIEGFAKYYHTLLKN